MTGAQILESSSTVVLFSLRLKTRRLHLCQDTNGGSGAENQIRHGGFADVHCPDELTGRLNVKLSFTLPMRSNQERKKGEMRRKVVVDVHGNL
ncbi:hypothetical protein VTO42DRAFT_4052 [Malbranchea cinnamomea]